MSSVRLFKRSPRLLPSLPAGEFEIVAPANAPSKPSTSLVTVLLPIGGTLIGFSIIIAVANSSSSSTSLLGTMAGTFSILLATYLVSIINYSSQKKKFTTDTQARQGKYQQYLVNVHKELERMYRQQADACRQVSPAPAECMRRVETLDARLWERAPQDADFLSLRLGIGRQPFLVKIKLPRIDPTQDPDPLVQEAHRLGKGFESVPSVPMNYPLAEAGVGGVAGERRRLLNLVRAMIMQIATQHSPDDVKIVVVYPASEEQEWDWTRWLPHVWTEDHRQRLISNSPETAHRLLTDLNDLLLTRKRSLERERGVKQDIPLPRYVIILADPSLVEREPILNLLLNDGPSLGAYPLFLCPTADSLPQGCRAIAQVGPIASSFIRTDQPGQIEFTPDEVTQPTADSFARSMAAIRLQRFSTAADIPASVALLEILEVDRVEDLDLMSRWRSHDPSKTLAAPIGRKAGGDVLLLDLHAARHGPHGLGAGTTGSGKSELLQSLVASLAVNYHPHEVSFVLVDFKGGGMSNAFEKLPHLVGTITNLEGNLASRALRAFQAEMKQRQVWLADAGENNIDDYLRKWRRGEVRQPMPHLVIIVDEFAELASQMPDFLNELVSAARVGRSLGVHLILTTQKPAGVVSEQIWSNSRFRFCLRVERPADSQEVLRRQDAASLTRPGQAFLQVGNDEIFERFQAAWGGAPYQPGGFVVRDPHEVLEVTLDGNRRLLRLSPNPTRIETAATQLEAVVNHVYQVAEQNHIPRLQGPWLPPLPDQITLEAIRPAAGWDGQTWRPVSTWMNPVVGLLDDPNQKRQEPLRLDFGKEGHLAIYGAPSSGKTTLLQTLITSLALDHSPEDVHLYLMDFGARILTLFKDLPHVGGIILGDDPEILQRLLRFVVSQLETRKRLFSQAGLGSLSAYRAAQTEKIPAIVVVVDNFPGFTGAFPDSESIIAQVAQEGGNLGVHLVLTANGPTQIRMRISNNITSAVTLRLADRADYAQAVGVTGGLEPASLPGRGLVKGKPPLEFQAALPVDAPSQADRTQTLQALMASMAAAGGPRAAPIPMPPRVVTLDTLLPASPTYLPVDEKTPLAVPLAMDLDKLTALEVDLAHGPNFLITGAIQSGKTTLLQTWLLALAERFSPQQVQFYLVDYQQESLFSLHNLPHVRSYILDDDMLGEALGEIGHELTSRRHEREQKRKKAADADSSAQKHSVLGPALIFAVDDFELFKNMTQPGLLDRLEQLVRRERGMGMHILLVASINEVASAYSGLIKALKEIPTGFLLGTTDSSHLSVFNVRLPVDETGRMLPAGEGIFARRGAFNKVKTATPCEGALTLPDWVQQITKK